jgi:hypothetical protein
VRHVKETSAFLGAAHSQKYALRYNVGIFTKILYCAYYGYYFYVYVGDSLQFTGNITGHFTRVVGLMRVLNLGHPQALYADLDSFVGIRTAVPLENFFETDLNIQAERALCSGVVAIKNSEWGRNFLRNWWSLGHGGCCVSDEFDQNAFVWLIAEELQAFTNDSITRPANFRSPQYPP